MFRVCGTCKRRILCAHFLLRFWFISETKGEMLTELGEKNLFGKEFPRLFKWMTTLISLRQYYNSENTFIWWSTLKQFSRNNGPISTILCTTLSWLTAIQVCFNQTILFFFFKTENLSFLLLNNVGIIIVILKLVFNYKGTVSQVSDSCYDLSNL